MIIFDLFEDNNKNPHNHLMEAGHDRSQLFAELLAQKIAQSYPDGFTMDFADSQNLAQWLKTWPVKRWAQEFNRLQDYEQSSTIDCLWNELRKLGFEPDASEQNWAPRTQDIADDNDLMDLLIGRKDSVAVLEKEMQSDSFKLVLQKLREK